MSFSSFKVSLISFFYVGVFLVISVNVYAQSPRDPGARFLEEQERAAERSRLENARPGQKIEVDAPKRVEREKICFPINAIRVKGLTVLDPEKISKLLETYKDTCMGQKAIGALLQVINKTYIEAGFITSKAYVPQQDLADGELLIEVVEGRIAGFVYRVVDKDGTIEAGKARKIKNAFPIKAGDIFQLRLIEQGLDQINRLASSQATIDLIPGDQPGTSLVVVTEQKRDRYRVSAGYDNRGSESTGINRYRASIAADDLLNLNDTYSLSFLTTQNTNVLAFNYSIPYGLWTFSGAASYSESLNSLSPLSDLFNQTVSASINAERLLKRDGTKKIWAYSRFGHYWNSRFINLAELTPQERRAVTIGLRAERYFKKGVLSADLGLTRGIPFLGADSDLDDLPDDVPRAEFNKVDLSMNYLRRQNDFMQFSSAFAGQWANVPLFSEQQLTIGGWDSVRGFHGDEVSGERGFLLRNELAFILPEIGKHISAKDAEIIEKKSLKESFWRQIYNNELRKMQPYIFADLGYVDNIAREDHTTMMGLGFGFRGNIKRANVDAALAVPLTNGAIVEPGELQGLISVSFKIF